MNKLLINNFANVKVGQINKLLSIFLYVNKTSLKLLRTFEKEGLIRGFKYLDKHKGYLCVYFKYDATGQRLIKDLVCLSNARKRIFIKASQLKKLNDSFNFYFITNKSGEFMLNSNKSIDFKVGAEIKYLIKINSLNHNLKELI